MLNFGLEKAENLQKDELQFMIRFVRLDSDFEGCDPIPGASHLKALWTAYCLHHDLEPDTNIYDMGILDLWNEITETYKDKMSGFPYQTFDDFDNYMCSDLV